MSKKKKSSEPVIKTGLRRFVLVREEDPTGMSGTGIVAEGVQFTNGRVALTWKTEFISVTTFDNIATVETLHTHFGSDPTKIVWLDPKPGEGD
jgi:hypothetical protein